MISKLTISYLTVSVHSLSQVERGAMQRPGSTDGRKTPTSDPILFNYATDISSDRVANDQLYSSHAADLVSDTSSIASSCLDSPSVTPSLTPTSSFESLLNCETGKSGRGASSGAQGMEQRHSEKVPGRTVSPFSSV